MRKQLLHIIKMLLVISSVVSFSCTRESDIKLPEHVPTLVLHGYVNVGDTFRVMLGKTLKADLWVSMDESFVTDGWVLLYEGSIFKDSLKYNPATKQYVSSKVTAQAGKTYKIIAGANDFVTIEATATSPQTVNTISIHRIKNARVDASGISLDDVKYIFADPVAEKNFYIAALYPADPNKGSVCVYSYDPSVEKYTEGLIPFDQNSCIGNTEILFTDKSFNGKQKELSLSIESTLLDKYIDPISGRIIKPNLKKFNIAEAHYKYFKNTKTLYLNSGVPTLTDPIIINGNVKNGYGLFTVFTSTTDSLP